MTSRPPRLRPRSYQLALLAMIAACASEDATLLDEGSSLSPAPPSGAVALAVDAGDLRLASLRITLRDDAGRIVLDVLREPSSSGAGLVVELALPVGAGYRLVLAGELDGGARCTGEAAFDVLDGLTTEVPVTLACEASGNVRVIGSVIASENCPSVSLAPPTGPVPVGGTVQLRASASGPEATYAWASSGGALGASLSAEASLACTEPGPVTLTLTATADGCASSAATVVQCVAAEDDCAALGSTCHLVDPGSGPLHDCHEIGHAGEANACSAARASCVTSCGAELCAALGSLCHEVDPGSGPLHDCHELGHAGDASACFARGRECFELCSEARAAASQPVELSFEARVGAEAFACGARYAGLGSTGVEAEPQDLRFFVSEVRLIDASGREEPLILDARAPWQVPEVALLDFEDATGLCASGTPQTNRVVTGRVFPGQYVGVAFRVSVPEAINHADPALQPAPLELGSMSWGWLLGYRFLRAELATSGADAGAAVPALLHLGSTGCSGNPQAGSVVCANPNRNEVRLDGFDPAASRIVADVAALFADTDLSQESLCHSTGEPCRAPFESVGIDFETGAPAAEQTFFRLE